MTEMPREEVQAAFVECRIEWRPSGYRSGEFVAAYAGEAPWSLAGRSGKVRTFGKSHVAESEAARLRFAELCATLESTGWRSQGSGIPDPWYALCLRRTLPGPKTDEAEAPHVQEPAVSPADPVDTSSASIVPLARPDDARQELSTEAEEGPPVEEEPPLTDAAAEPVDDAPWWDLRSTPRPVSAPTELDSEFCDRVRRYVA